MNKTTKGAVAAGAAAVLLVGGAGTLAYWTDTAEIHGGTVNSGELTIVGFDAGEWTYDGTKAVDQGIVPGDDIQMDFTATIRFAGENLKAQVSLAETAGFTAAEPATAADEALAAALDDATITIDELSDNANWDPVTKVLSGTGEVELTGTISTSFPWGDAGEYNAAMLGTAAWDGVTLNVTQVGS